MWVEDSRRSWIQIVLFGGRVLPRIWPRVLFVVALSLVVTVLFKYTTIFHLAITPTPFNLIGWPLALFLGFRNSATYDRFWEGRKLWGQLVNQTRSFTRQAQTLVQGEGAAPIQRELVMRTIAFAHALRCLLREKSPLGDLKRFLPEDEATAIADAINPPVMILQSIGRILAAARARGLIDPLHVPVLEQSLVVFTDVQGACERIKSTPLPFSYTVLMHRVVAVYCSLLPFGLTDAIGWVTPLVVMFISYCFFGLDAVGDELEQPFGHDTNDLALNSITRVIERTLLMQLGEKELPPALEPVDNFLT